ncbi:MAG: hypothetical protein RJQ09_11985 [Cyclobacteriaceae bacterium]
MTAGVALTLTYFIDSNRKQTRQRLFVIIFATISTLTLVGAMILFSEAIQFDYGDDTLVVRLLSYFVPLIFAACDIVIIKNLFSKRGYWVDNSAILADLQKPFDESESNSQTSEKALRKSDTIGCADCFTSEISEFLDQRTWLEFDLELTKRLGRNQMKTGRFINDGIPDKDGGLDTYVCQSCQTKWKLREPNDRGGGYFRLLK